MKYTLMVLGFPRTGTGSLWKFLDNHPQVSVSKVKEPIWEWDKKNPDSYLDFYEIKEDTKVIADCTPVLTTGLWKTEYVKKLSKLPFIDRFCCLYTLRDDPFARLNSYIDILIKSYYVKPWRWAEIGFAKPGFLDENNEFIEELLFFMCREYLDEHKMIKTAENFFRKENLFISKIAVFEQTKLWDFLNIDRYVFELLHDKNGLVFRNTLGYVKYLKKKYEFDQWFIKNVDEFERIKQESCKKIEVEYGFKL
jgi:hypothetical protein